MSSSKLIMQEMQREYWLWLLLFVQCYKSVQKATSYRLKCFIRFMKKTPCMIFLRIEDIFSHCQKKLLAKFHILHNCISTSVKKNVFSHVWKVLSVYIVSNQSQRAKCILDVLFLLDHFVWQRQERWWLNEWVLP